jgi:hypothetical protein
MADECIEFRKIEGRCRELKEWISHRAPQCFQERKHLDEGSEERGYWAHGYLSALQDVVGLFSSESLTDQEDEHGTSSSRYAA